MCEAASGESSAPRSPHGPCGPHHPALASQPPHASDSERAAHSCGGDHPLSSGPQQQESHTPRAGRGRWARVLIRGYQDYISDLKMGPTCRFDPTCSNYALTALSTHGTVKGLILTVGRLARCGPWHPGGWDPVPPPRDRNKR